MRFFLVFEKFGLIMVLFSILYILWIINLIVKYFCWEIVGKDLRWDGEGVC